MAHYVPPRSPFLRGLPLFLLCHLVLILFLDFLAPSPTANLVLVLFLYLPTSNPMKSGDYTILSKNKPLIANPITLNLPCAAFFIAVMKTLAMFVMLSISDSGTWRQTSKML
jgi:hypothetical protein